MANETLTYLPYLPNPLEGYLVLNTADQVHFLFSSDLIYVRAEGSYSFFVSSCGMEREMSKPLRAFEDQLISFGFFRIHRSYMVNIRHLISIDKLEGLAWLSNKVCVPFSKHRLNVLIENSFFKKEEFQQSVLDLKNQCI